jgi:hypothetical protein
VFHTGIHPTHRTLLLAAATVLGAIWIALTATRFVWPASERPEAADAVVVMAAGAGRGSTRRWS